MTDVIYAEHIGAYYIRVDFDGPMRADVNLRASSNYTVSGPTIVTDVLEQTAQSQYYLGPPIFGGAPRSVYLQCDRDVATTGASVTVTVKNAGAGDPVDYYGNLLINNSYVMSTISTVSDFYWEDDSLRVTEARKEIGKTGAKYKSKTTTPINYSLVTMMGKLADLVSGGHLSTLNTNIDGPLEGIDALPVEGLTPGGFSPPLASTPGVGDTISFVDNKIPAHVDKLWGPCNGSNTVFRTSIFFHPQACILLYIPPAGTTETGAIIDNTDWYSPQAGKDRLIKLINAPSEGASIIAVYIPRKSLLRINEEIIAYDNSDFNAGTVEIVGREQLSTEFQEHFIGDTVEDLWATSFVGRALYNLLCWGASGTALEQRANDLALSRTDNPALTDIDLRRAVFNTAVNMRGTPGTFDQAMRYIYPNLWPHITYAEDPRWPNCVTIFFSEEVIGDTSWISEPEVEPWETWIDHIAWLDGIETDLLYDTYYRDPITDVSYFGDFFLEDGLENPAIAPYPVVMGGVPITILGMPAPNIPPISTVSSEYKNYITRPHGLDRALPCGIGVLLLDYGYLT